MLDQCIITVPDGPLVKPEIFTDVNFKIDDWLQFAVVGDSIYRRFSQDGPQITRKHWFDLFGTRVLRIHTKPVGTRKEPYRQVIDRIELNLAKIAHGHNAIPIRHPLELCGALILVRHVLSGVLENPEKASTLIPGLVQGCRTHWSKIEIGMHVKDPGQALYKLMCSMRSKSARKHEHFENTVRLKGTNIIIKVYDKATEMVSKKIATKANLELSIDHPITRLEVELWGKKAASFDFLPSDQRPRTRMESGKPYLEGFTLEQLKAIHRHYFSELKGIYDAPKKPGDAAGTASVLAGIQLRYHIPVEELAGLYAKLGMRDRKKARTEAEEDEARKRAQRSMRTKIEGILAESSVVKAEEILSDNAYRGQPIIIVKGTYGHGEYYIGHHEIDSIWDFHHDPRADRQIREVYMTRNPKVFTPIMSLEWWT